MWYIYIALSVSDVESKPSWFSATCRMPRRCPAVTDSLLPVVADRLSAVSSYWYVDIGVQDQSA
jgi:hypothetical protein